MADYSCIGQVLWLVLSWEFCNHLKLTCTYWFVITSLPFRYSISFPVICLFVVKFQSILKSFATCLKLTPICFASLTQVLCYGTVVVDDTHFVPIWVDGIVMLGVGARG